MSASSTRKLAFGLVTSLFLLWGFCNGMIDVMDKHFQNELHLTLAQSASVQFAHYLGYFLMALPAGWLALRFGYKGGIIIGLIVVSIGGFWFLVATQLATFWAFLLGVCVIASGLAILETVANPYVTVLGDAKYAATRINLAQSFNGIGWIFGPIAGGMFFYSANASERLYIPYVGVAIFVLFLAAVFYFVNLPNIDPKDEYAAQDSMPGDSISLWSQPHFVMAVAAQFFYVAAQAGIFSFFINYMTSQVPPIPEGWYSGGAISDWFRKDASGTAAISDKGAANLASLAFVFFLSGRFIGALLLRKIAAHRLLAIYGVMNVLMAFLIFAKLGWVSVACVFLCYFFMSIMFPTIFALGIYGLGARTKRAAAYIVMAIIGGAILPKLMGAVADHSDMSRAFIVPMACFLIVALYGAQWPRFSRAERYRSR